MAEVAESVTVIEESLEMDFEEVEGETDSAKQDQSEETTEKKEKLVKLPLGRVKHIIKLDPDVSAASMDAVFLITKATELFVASLAAESYSFTAQNKKKPISKGDVDMAMNAVECLAFLEGAMED